MSGSAFLLVLIAAGALLSLDGGSVTDPEQRSYAVLEEDLEPFRSAFNEASDRARSVLLVGPTWGVCLRGVSEVDKAFKATGLTEMPVFVISSTQLGAEEDDIRNAIGLMAGDNVHHYWDGERSVGSALGPTFGIDYPAWDVWLLYGPRLTWGTAPPEPSWWEHQLSDLDHSYPDLRLDAERFAKRALDLSEQ